MNKLVAANTVILSFWSHGKDSPLTVQDLMKERSEAVTKEYNMEANGWLIEGAVDCEESRQLAFV